MRRDGQRHFHFFADHFSGQAAAFHIDQHALAEFDVKIAAVGAMVHFCPQA